MASPGDDGHSVFTAEERGETTGRASRIIVRLVIIAVFLSGMTAVVLVGRGGVATGDAASAGGSVGPASSASPPALALTAQPSGTATRVPVAASASGPRQPSSLRQSALVEAEDHIFYDVAKNGAAAKSLNQPVVRYSSAVKGKAMRTFAGGSGEVFLKRAIPYGFNDLIASTAAVRLDSHTVLLIKRVIVQRGASLVLHAPGQTLLLASDAHQFVSIVGWGADISISGTLTQPMFVQSWDSATQTADENLTDGRAYIRVNDAKFTTNFMYYNKLGFWSGRTGGVAVTGSTESAATGMVNNTTMTGSHMGIYLSGVDKFTVRASAINLSRQQGIEVSNGSTNVSIIDTAVNRSGGNGIDAQTGTSRFTLNHVTTSNNGGFGVRFDGEAQATGPNPGGYGVQNASVVIMRDVLAVDNAQAAISVLSTNSVSIANVAIAQNSVGIVVSGNSSAISMKNLTVTSKKRDAVHILDGPRNVVISKSIITGRQIGLLVRDADVTATDNRITVNAGNGIVVEGATSAGILAGNTLTGVGPSAISTVGTSPAMDVRENIARGWTVRTELIMWADRHPLAWLWGALLLIPAIGFFFIFRRLRRQRRIRHLVETTTIALAAAERETYLEQQLVQVDAESRSLSAGGGAVRVPQVRPSGPPPRTAVPVFVSEAVPEYELDVAAEYTPEVLHEVAPLREKQYEPEPREVPATPVAPTIVHQLVGAAAGIQQAQPEVQVSAPAAPAEILRAGPPQILSHAAGLPSAPLAAVRQNAPVSTSASTPAPIGAGAGRRIPAAHAAPPTIVRAIAGTARVEREVAQLASASGRFASVEELAVTAVIEGGRPIDTVAKTLRVSSSLVAHWVAKANQTPRR